jgi:hypothetical protein
VHPRGYTTVHRRETLFRWSHNISNLNNLVMKGILRDFFSNPMLLNNEFNIWSCHLYGHVWPNSWDLYFPTTHNKRKSNLQNDKCYNEKHVQWIYVNFVFNVDNLHVSQDASLMIKEIPTYSIRNPSWIYLHMFLLGLHSQKHSWGELHLFHYLTFLRHLSITCVFGPLFMCLYYTIKLDYY